MQRLSVEQLQFVGNDERVYVANGAFKGLGRVRTGVIFCWHFAQCTQSLPISQPAARLAPCDRRDCHGALMAPLLSSCCEPCYVSGKCIKILGSEQPFLTRLLCPQVLMQMLLMLLCLSAQFLRLAVRVGDRHFLPGLEFGTIVDTFEFGAFAANPEPGFLAIGRLDGDVLALFVDF